MVESKENINQVLDNFANSSIKIMSEALAEKDAIIRGLREQIKDCKCKETTKLIIEGKEFEIIKYSCDYNDKWYIGELGLVIEKKVMTRDDWDIKKGDIIWDGASSGKEKEQLKKLIYFGECEIDYWKKKIKELKKTPHDFTRDKETFQRLSQYETSLQKAINGLEDLKRIGAKVIFLTCKKCGTVNQVFQTGTFKWDGRCENKECRDPLMYQGVEECAKGHPKKQEAISK